MNNISRSVPESVGSGWLLWLRRHPLIGYFLLAFTLTWVWSVLNHGILHLPQVPLGWLGPFLGPTLAAFLMTALIEGKAGMIHLLRRYWLWRVPFQWYLVVLLIRPALYLLCVVLLPGTLATFQVPTAAFWLSYLQIFTFIFFFGGPLGEEPGWRGFALPRLQQHWGPLVGTLLLGLLHGVWHLPLFLLIPGYNGAGTGWPGISLAFVVFVVSVIHGAVIFTWVFNNTRGSLLMAILLHASVNTSGIFLQLFPSLPQAHLGLVRPLVVIVVAWLIIIATRGRLSYERYQREVIL